MAGYPTDEEILAELKRELKMRESVYPKWVSAGRLNEVTMRHRLACQRRAIERFEELTKEGRLF